MTGAEILTRDAVDAVVFDFDGVLTDNRVLVLQDGSEAVFCNRSDGLGIARLKQAGIRCFILSTETNPVVAARGRKLDIPVVQSVSDKADGLRRLCADHGLDLARVLFVGNDVNDLPALSIAGIAAVVADAYPEARAAAQVVLESAGGAGAAREIAGRLVPFDPAP